VTTTTSDVMTTRDWEGWARQYGTPTHVLDTARLHANVRALKQAWNRLIVPMEILYSVKTNYLPFVLRTLRDEVDGADVVSGYELRAALKAGYPASRICFNGPMKTEDEIDEAIRHGVVVHVDSPSDIDAIERASHGRPVEIGVRVNPGTNVYDSPDPTFETAARKRASNAKFGWPLGSPGLDRLLERIEANSRLRLTRLHAHLGSQITSADRMLSGLDSVFAFCAGQFGRFPIEVVNIGGGFGVSGIFRHRHGALYALRELHGDAPPGQPRQALDLHALVDGVNARVQANRLAHLRLQCEPGRVLVSDAMSLLVRVVSVKDYGPGFGTWVVVDGGLNLMPTAGPHEEHRVELLTRRSADASQPAQVSVMLGGPLCYEGDVFDYSAQFPRLPSVGDLIVIRDSGAYTVSRSTNFIRPRAAVIAVGEGGSSPVLCWRRETDDDIFQFAVG
jgi:diaminopimelate decarboxylase